MGDWIGCSEVGGVKGEGEEDVLIALRDACSAFCVFCLGSN
jgi:hypothetical protein